MTTKLELIESLAVRVKNNDKIATDELVSLFTPLIFKISKQIQIRYGNIFPIDEIIRQAKCCLVYLTVSKYTPGGKAHYPYFIKKTLHAQLVIIYRPIYAQVARSVTLEDVEYKLHVDGNPITEGERVAVCDKIVEYIETNLNKREQDIFYSIVARTPRNDLARKYHVSFTRMKTLHKRILKKLRKQLSDMGIEGMEDV